MDTSRGGYKLWRIQVVEDASCGGYKLWSLQVVKDTGCWGYKSLRIPVVEDTSCGGYKSWRIQVVEDTSRGGYESDYWMILKMIFISLSLFHSNLTIIRSSFPKCRLHSYFTFYPLNHLFSYSFTHTYFILSVSL